MATGFVYWDNLMMAQMAELTGRVEDRQKYLAKAEEFKKRINDHFFDPQTVVIGCYDLMQILGKTFPICFGNNMKIKRQGI